MIAEAFLMCDGSEFQTEGPKRSPFVLYLSTKSYRTQVSALNKVVEQENRDENIIEISGRRGVNRNEVNSTLDSQVASLLVTDSMWYISTGLERDEQ